MIRHITAKPEAECAIEREASSIQRPFFQKHGVDMHIAQRTQPRDKPVAGRLFQLGDIDRLRNTQFQIDPTIGYRAGAAKRQLGQSFINPLGGYSTPQRDEAIRRSMGRQIDEDAATQFRAGQYDVNNQNYSRNLAVAGLTAPPLVQSGSSYTGQEKFKTPFSAKIMPALQQGAQTAAMMM